MPIVCSPQFLRLSIYGYDLAHLMIVPCDHIPQEGAWWNLSSTRKCKCGGVELTRYEMEICLTREELVHLVRGKILAFAPHFESKMVAPNPDLGGPVVNPLPPGVEIVYVDDTSDGPIGPSCPTGPNGLTGPTGTAGVMTQTIFASGVAGYVTSPSWPNATTATLLRAKVGEILVLFFDKLRAMRIDPCWHVNVYSSLDKPGELNYIELAVFDPSGVRVSEKLFNLDDPPSSVVDKMLAWLEWMPRVELPAEPGALPAGVTRKIELE